ncbi:MAG: hypothetical protein WD770_11100 [Actinomycetota bacterium]
MGKSAAGFLLILAGIALIFLRARKKGDIQLAGGVWPVIEKLGDAVYILGALMIVVGAALIDRSIIDLFTGGEGDGTPTPTSSPT